MGTAPVTIALPMTTPSTDVGLPDGPLPAATRPALTPRTTGGVAAG